MLLSLGVCSLVVLQLLFRNEPFSTARMSALVRFVTSMRVDMPCEFGFVAKALSFATARPMAVIFTAWLSAWQFTSMVLSYMAVEVFGAGVVIVADIAAPAALMVGSKQHSWHNGSGCNVRVWPYERAEDKRLVRTSRRLKKVRGASEDKG
ncbi:hypothetical protein KC357_g92 [Hortaea werneckii]|nr:hypothetical protein KC357_g92 [Hortaea werneckii]